MSPVEMFDVVDAEDRVVGCASRAACHGNPALIHRTAHLVVVSTDGRLLLQKRAACKDVQPGKWDTAVGGHLEVGERYEAAICREAAEEIGLSVRPEQLQTLFDSRIRNSVESENVRVFGIVHDGPFRPAAGEIDGLRFWSPRELS